MKKLIALAAITFALACTTPEKTEADNLLTEAETAEGWILLFDGKTNKGWRGFNKTTFPAGWVIDSGTLKALGVAEGDTGGDIVYEKESFEFFELVWDWKISPGGNSGVFYHVIEDTQYAAPYHTGPEYQLIDDVTFPQKLENWQKTGADYAMYDPPTDKILNPVGDWNTSRVLVSPEKVEYFLNGKRTVSFVRGSEDWLQRRNSGKWDAFPDYAKSHKGLIALQDHGSEAWFKNIKIRKID
jgi:hypothetical protein